MESLIQALNVEELIVGSKIIWLIALFLGFVKYLAEDTKLQIVIGIVRILSESIVKLEFIDVLKLGEVNGY